MLEFLHKYQEELFDEKRDLENEIKALEVEQRELVNHIQEVTARADDAFASLSPLSVGSADQIRLQELTAKLGNTTNRLDEKTVKLKALVQRITKVQNLLIDMSDWKFDTLPEDEVPPEVRYGEEVVEKTDELLFDDSLEEKFELAEKLQKVYDDIGVDPDLARAELRGIIQRLID